MSNIFNTSLMYVTFDNSTYSQHGQRCRRCMDWKMFFSCGVEGGLEWEYKILNAGVGVNYL